MQEQFRLLRMREFSALMARHNERQEQTNYRLAVVVSSMYNVNLEKFDRKKPFTPEDFLGVQVDMLETAKALTEFYGGEVKCPK